MQRLVDVLWSQDIDLGAGRETFEYPIHPPKDVHQQKPDPKFENFPPQTQTNSSGRYAYGSTQNVLENYYVDSETGMCCLIRLLNHSMPFKEAQYLIN